MFVNNPINALIKSVESFDSTHKMKLSSLLVAVSAVSAQFFSAADFDALAHKKPNKGQQTPVVDKVREKGSYFDSMLLLVDFGGPSRFRFSKLV